MKSHYLEWDGSPFESIMEEEGREGRLSTNPYEEQRASRTPQEIRRRWLCYLGHPEHIDNDLTLTFTLRSLQKVIRYDDY